MAEARVPCCCICGLAGDGDNPLTGFCPSVGPTQGLEHGYQRLLPGTVETQLEQSRSGQSDFGIQDALPSSQRRHEVIVCARCIGNTPSYQWIAGYTAERDGQERAAGVAAARRERLRLGLPVSD